MLSAIWRNSQSSTYANLLIRKMGPAIQMELPLPVVNTLNPDTTRAIYWQSMAYVQAGDIMSAELALTSLVDRGDRFALSLMGEIALREGNLDLAIQHWLNAGNAAILASMAEEAKERGDFQNAVALLDALVSINPSSNRAKFLLGEALYLNDNYSSAEYWLAAAIEKETRSDWLLVMARNAMKNNKAPVAIQTYNQIIDLNDSLPGPYYELSGVYLSLGQTDKALEAVNNAIRVSKDDAPSYFFRSGEIFEASGEVVRAKEMYEMTLKLNPTHQAAQDRLFKLMK